MGAAVRNALEHVVIGCWPIMIHLGPCFLVRDEPTKFGNTTAAAVGKMKQADAPWWLLSGGRAAILAMLVQAK